MHDRRGSCDLRRRTSRCKCALCACDCFAHCLLNSHECVRTRTVSRFALALSDLMRDSTLMIGSFLGLSAETIPDTRAACLDVAYRLTIWAGVSAPVIVNTTAGGSEIRPNLSCFERLQALRAAFPRSCSSCARRGRRATFAASWRSQQRRQLPLTQSSWCSRIGRRPARTMCSCSARRALPSTWRQAPASRCARFLGA